MHPDFNKPFSLLKVDGLFVSKIKEQYKFIQYSPGAGRSRYAALSEVWPGFAVHFNQRCKRGNINARKKESIPTKTHT